MLADEQVEPLDYDERHKEGRLGLIVNPNLLISIGLQYHVINIHERVRTIVPLLSSRGGASTCQ